MSMTSPLANRSDKTRCFSIRAYVRSIAERMSHTIANRGCWSWDGQTIFFDIRDDETQFDSPVILQLDVVKKYCKPAYLPSNRVVCGVPTCSPVDDRVVFIHADEPRDDDWLYCAWHRRGSILDPNQPDGLQALDARDIVPPFTAGALRGGTHLHTFNSDATAIVSTYEDHVLATATSPLAQANRRGIAVHVLNSPITVPKTHHRNHDGTSFSVLVSHLTDHPLAGSDQISMTTGEAWLAGRGHRIAVQGTVVDRRGNPCVELFLITLPDELNDLRMAGNHPLQGTPTTRPGVPAAVMQRRLTFTTERPFPGIAGPRHWAVGSPDGSRIGCYLRDNHGKAQFWTVASDSGETIQVTHQAPEPTSPFTWHPDGLHVAFIADGSVMMVNTRNGSIERLTPRLPVADGPTHHACVFSPDGSSIAFMQPVAVDSAHPAKRFNQIHIVTGWANN
jgi:hypothetical protein